MLENQITLSLKEAKEFYNSTNPDLKKLALRAFSETDLLSDEYTQIKTFKDACDALHIDHIKACDEYCRLTKFSKSIAALFKLNIIVRALNYFHTIDADKTSTGNIWYPRIEFHLKKDKKVITPQKICEIIQNSRIYEVIYSKIPCLSAGKGYLNLDNYDYGQFDLNYKIIGCATEATAIYLSKQFGMLIVQALLGDTNMKF